MIYYSDLFKDPRFKRATILGLMLSFFSQFTGAYAFLFFSNTLFEDVTVLNSDWITTALAVFNLIGTTAVLKLVDYYGRRSLLLFGSFTIAIVLNVAGILTLMVGSDFDEYILVLLILVYIFLFSISFGPISWVYAAEIMEDKGLGLFSSFNWFYLLVISIAMPFVITAITDDQERVFMKNTGYIYIFFANVTFISFFYLLLNLKET